MRFLGKLILILKCYLFYQGAGITGVVSRARIISLSACLGRQLPSSELPDEFLGINSANLLKESYGGF
jgi:hypothetical protein